MFLRYGEDGYHRDSALYPKTFHRSTIFFYQAASVLVQGLTAVPKTLLTSCESSVTSQVLPELLSSSGEGGGEQCFVKCITVDFGKVV